MNPSDPLLTAKQVAAWLQVSVDAVYLWAANGTLPCVRIGKTVRFKREVVEAALADWQPPAPVQPVLRRPERRVAEADPPWRNYVLNEEVGIGQPTTTRATRPHKESR